jgi:Cft2 family RNA processing exonuclease
MLTFDLHAFQYWAQRHLVYPIYFLTNVSTSTVDYVKSFLEWMSDSISKSFEHSRDNAFLLRYCICLVMHMLSLCCSSGVTDIFSLWSSCSWNTIIRAILNIISRSSNSSYDSCVIALNLCPSYIADMFH